MAHNYSYADFETLGYTNSTVSTLISVAQFINLLSLNVVKYQFVLACIGVVVNIFHLIILLRKTMRSNSINVIMTGIGACDLFNMSVLVYGNLLAMIHPNSDCFPPASYTIQLMELWAAAIKDDLRRLSAWFGVLMAVIRLLIIKFSLNPKFNKLSKPGFSVLLMLIALILSTCWSSFYWARLTLVEVEPWKPEASCTGFPANYTEVQYVVGINAEFLSDALMMIQIFLISDGILKIIPTIMFPILTFLLIRELKRAENSRRKIAVAVQRKEDRSDHTTNLVILMTVTFMTAEGPLGIVYVIQGLVTNNAGFTEMASDVMDIFTLFVALNAITHCIICLTVSSQYRKTVKDLFMCKGASSSSAILVSAKVSVSSIQDPSVRNHS